ncbi:hypothetical protein [Butyrivibrio sp. MC2013]|uniref:hypothetical protein n=1 Tax=Butyrivibrio sp. MC2013 TaxID=1280686 RepID=UPI0004057959|nr:hypothetical protein [Butyrivibrio sp. MC2013]
MRRKPARILTGVFVAVTVLSIGGIVYTFEDFNYAREEISYEKDYLKELKTMAAEEESYIKEEIDGLKEEKDQYLTDYEELVKENKELEKEVEKLYDKATVENLRELYTYEEPEYDEDGSEADMDEDDEMDTED